MDLGKIQKAQSLLDEGIALIDKRQKIIKIADNDGRDTVQAYTLAMILLETLGMINAYQKPKYRAEFKRRESERIRRRRRARYNFCSSSFAGSSTSTGPVSQTSFPKFSN